MCCADQRTTLAVLAHAPSRQRTKLAGAKLGSSGQPARTSPTASPQRPPAQTSAASIRVTPASRHHGRRQQAADTDHPHARAVGPPPDHLDTVSMSPTPGSGRRPTVGVTTEPRPRAAINDQPNGWETRISRSGSRRSSCVDYDGGCRRDGFSLQFGTRRGGECSYMIAVQSLVVCTPHRPARNYLPGGFLVYDGLPKQNSTVRAIILST
jgi:hypothetical protein